VLVVWTMKPHQIVGITISYQIHVRLGGTKTAPSPIDMDKRGLGLTTHSRPRPCGCYRRVPLFWHRNDLVLYTSLMRE
jgi:hypothetical protein